MQLGGVMGGIFKISDVIMRLAYLNLLWFAGALAGGIILGVMPATVALFSIVRSWQLEDETLIFHQEFLKVYKSEFLKSNLLGLGMGAVGYLLFINFQVTSLIVENQTIIVVLIFSNILAAVFLGLLILFIFPIYVHFEMSLFEKVKFAVLFGITNPHITFALLITILLFSLLFVITPSIIFFFSISSLAYCITGVSLKKINDTKEKLSSGPINQPGNS